MILVYIIELLSVLQSILKKNIIYFGGGGLVGEIRNGYSYNYWYCMRDAGVDGEAVRSENLVSGHNGKDFWELAGTYYQCRLALVKRK